MRNPADFEEPKYYGTWGEYPLMAKRSPAHTHTASATASMPMSSMAFAGPPMQTFPEKKTPLESKKFELLEAWERDLDALKALKDKGVDPDRIDEAIFYIKESMSKMDGIDVETLRMIEHQEQKMEEKITTLGTLTQDPGDPSLYHGKVSYVAPQSITLATGDSITFTYRLNLDEHGIQVPPPPSPKAANPTTMPSKPAPPIDSSKSSKRGFFKWRSAKD